MADEKIRFYSDVLNDLARELSIDDPIHYSSTLSSLVREMSEAREKRNGKKRFVVYTPDVVCEIAPSFIRTAKLDASSGESFYQVEQFPIRKTKGEEDIRYHEAITKTLVEAFKWNHYMTNHNVEKHDAAIKNAIEYNTKLAKSEVGLQSLVDSTNEDLRLILDCGIEREYGRSPFSFSKPQ